MLLLTYKSLQGIGPSYLKDLLTVYKPSRVLRSASEQRLVPLRARTEQGKRAFAYAAPTLWNELPLELKVIPTVDFFKKHLKTYLFKNAF